jgi:hypothetical protein
MAVHIFVVDENNYEICKRKGLAAIPNSNNPNIKDALISRMSLIKRNDLVLFYISGGAKELRGVYKILELPFYDESLVWPQNEDGQVYPLRVRIDNWKYSFANSINLSNIYDLRDQGLIWTFSLRRPNTRTTNTMFSISNMEFDHLLDLYLKKNILNREPQQIREPYPYFNPNILEYLSFDENNEPRYEYTLMSLLLRRLAMHELTDKFGEYSDYLAYVPTSFEKEIDILLITNNPFDLNKVLSYNILELKRDRFDENGLSQLLQYEDWFLNKKVNGDFNMLRTTAIAKSFSLGVINYLKQRKELENKRVSLFEYTNHHNNLTLTEVIY